MCRVHKKLKNLLKQNMKLAELSLHLSWIEYNRQ